MFREDGSTHLRIKHHKTYYKYGPANVTINNNLALLMEIYQLKIRSFIQNKYTPANFFLTRTGQKLSSSSMKFYMQAVWQRLGLQSEVGPTLLRKTAVHLIAPCNKQDLASKMNHSEATASRYYLTLERGRFQTSFAQ